MKLFLLLVTFSTLASAQSLEQRVQTLEAKVRKLERLTMNMSAYCYCRSQGADDFRPIYVDRDGNEYDLGLGHGSGQWCSSVIQQNAACKL